ncbi:MAG: DUF6036 family nucleotidyltransferase [bacterium]
MDLKKELSKICLALNKDNVKYLLIGGCAIILHGYYRTTHDIDLLVEPSPENIRKLKNSLARLLGSKEVFEIKDDDITNYTVVRFAPEAEEIVIDLIGRVGEITYEVAQKEIEEVELEGISIPVCGLMTLIETKRGIRPKDKDDLNFLLEKKNYREKQSKLNGKKII